MKREECEKEILGKLRDIHDIYVSYLSENNAEWDGKYDSLSCAVFSDSVSVFSDSVSVFNSRSVHEKELPLSASYYYKGDKYVEWQI